MDVNSVVHLAELDCDTLKVDISKERDCFLNF